MKTTIFVRILLATLLPLILIFSLVIVTINNIIYTTGTSFAREATNLLARQTARQISEKLEATANLLELVSHSLGDVDYRGSKERTRAPAAIRRILAADPAIHSAWFAYEPEVFGDGVRHYEELVRHQGELAEARDLSPEILADPGRSPWYHRVLESGRVYLDMVGDYDYGLGDGSVLVAAINHPIFSGGRVIGGLGADLKYEDLFDPAAFRFGGRWQVLLVSSQGRILYSEDREQVGRGLLDYPFSDQERLAATLQDEEVFLGEVYSPLVGGESLVCVYPIPLDHGRQNIHLFLGISTKELYATARSSMEVIVATSFLGFLLLAFSIFVATRNIVRPIKRLTGDFNKIAHGDLNIVSREGGPGRNGRSRVVELDILESSLWKMLAQVNQAHELSLKAADERLEKERIVAAAQAKNQFFASMSHEIRTPMNAILGISEILLHDGHLTGSDRKYVSDIRVSSEALLAIINDILDLSKLESGKLSLIAVDFDFHQFLGHLRSVARHLMTKAGLVFLYEAEGDLPRCLYGDDIRLRQILLNLLSNAAKFTPAGSVTLKVAAENEVVRFAVSDTGVGIKPEDQAALFEPFTRIDAARNRTIQGTGLGLSISKNLLDLMGGSIELASEYGRGTTFAVTIPKVPGDAARLERKSAAGRTLYAPTLKVLLVDDHEINLTVAAGLLKTIHGLEADLARSGREALEKIQARGYHLVFMDHMMPEMDGVEATRRIRALGGAYEQLPVIALTANAVAGTREMLLASGFDDFLAKPILIEELARILEKWAPPDQRRPAAAEPPAAPSAEPPAIMARLAEIEAIDSAVGLESVAGEEGLYLELLRLLREKIPTQADLLAELLAREDLKRLAIEVHGLKSALASVGALALSEAARTLEAASVAGDRRSCRDRLPWFIRSLSALGQRLNQLFADREPADGQPVESKIPAESESAAGDRENAESQDEAELEALALALNRYDYEAITFHLAALSARDHDPVVAGTLADIGKRMKVFDYDGAAELLRRVLAF